MNAKDSRKVLIADDEKEMRELYLAGQLQANREKEERIERLRRDFVANVSHELRSPLTYLQGYTEALLNGLVRDPAERQRYLQLMLDETLRLKRMVNELLELESGGLGPGEDEVDAADLVHEAAQRFKPLAEKRGISLLIRTTRDLPLVRGHRDRRVQVLINLLDNAFRFTPDGGEVTVTASPAPAKARTPAMASSGPSVELAVSDTGEGIPPEDLPYICERFYKAYKARNRRKGSGLGLAIARNIVRAHGGEIEAESEPGRGTRFVVTLPAQPLNAWPDASLLLAPPSHPAGSPRDEDRHEPGW